MAAKKLKSARPNGWYVELLHYTNSTCGQYQVGSGEDEEDYYEFDDLPSAEAYYESEVERLSKIPNDELQARYDEEWGTDNGYGAHQSFEMEY